MEVWLGDSSTHGLCVCMYVEHSEQPAVEHLEQSENQGNIGSQWSFSYSWAGGITLITVGDPR